MAAKTYRVIYKANDGHMCAFKFETSRSFNLYHNSYTMDGIGLGRPFIEDMCKAAEKYNHEGTKMFQHGGFCYYGIRRIECMETGKVLNFTFC